MSGSTIAIQNARIWTPSGIYSSLSWNPDTGRIVSIGNADATHTHAQVIDMKGRMILPGLQDAHIHVLLTGNALSRLILNGTKSIAELQDKLKAFVAVKAASMRPSDAALTWIVGAGWDQDSLGLPKGAYPTRFDLDAVVSDRPVVLFRACYHICVVNTFALRLAGLLGPEPTAQVPSGGVADTDDQNQLTGILRENAIRLVAPHFEENLPRSVQKEFIEQGLQACLRAGLTAIQSNDEWSWDVYQELEQEGKVPIRVFMTPMCHEVLQAWGSGKKEGAQLPSSVPKPGDAHGMVSCHRVKIFTDGSLGAETAALRLPYAGTDNRGVSIHTTEALRAQVREAHALGYRLEIHAIGDAAAEQVLDVWEQEGVVGPEHRPILTHCQVLGSDLIARMAKMNVVADVQPSFVGTDSLWVAKRLGDGASADGTTPEVAAALQDRLRSSYAWKTLLKEGVHTAGGSDSPVETCSPLAGLHAAIFRHPNGQQLPWMPEQCLSFEEAMLLYTQEAAYAAKQEHQLGQLAPNYMADFVVLETSSVDDPFGLHTAPVWENPASLLSVHAAQVWVGGKLKLDASQTVGSGKGGSGHRAPLCMCHKIR